MLQISDFVIKRVIGKGTYCDVSLVVHKLDNKRYALKVVKFHESVS
jgi:serine/threonine protein kinase